MSQRLRGQALPGPETINSLTEKKKKKKKKKRRKLARVRRRRRRCYVDIPEERKKEKRHGSVSQPKCPN